MATITKGKTFTNGELVTPAALHSMVDSGTVTNIVNADIAAGSAIADTKLAQIATAGKVANTATTATSANAANAIVVRDAGGSFTAGTITAALSGNAATATTAAACSGNAATATTAAACSGNAATATTLQTARTINGVSFNGGGNITVTAAPSAHTHVIADTTGLQTALDGKAASAHTHGAGDITSGTLANAQLPARLQAGAQLITDWNNAVENGWYQGYSAANAPEGVLDWWLGCVETHYDRWVTQTVHRFILDAPTNTQIWRRSSVDSGATVRTFGAWYKLQLSQGEQDARYAATSDVRLSDARTPTLHTHDASNIITGTISNALTTATSANTANAIVARDASGDFSAGKINGLTVGVGKGGGSVNTNTALGHQVLNSNTSGASNTAVGYQSLRDNTIGELNTALGISALIQNTIGNGNTAVGYNTLFGNTTGSQNTAIGALALEFGNFSNCSGVGHGAQVTGSDQVQLGKSTATTYAYGAVQNRSDVRDKADIRDTTLGLDFVNALRPVDFKWDMREDYRPKAPAKISPEATDEEKAAYKIAQDKWLEDVKLANITHDGSKKRSRFHHGLIAQEVKAVLDSKGIDFGGYQDHSIKGGDDVLSIGYEELIAPMLKAIQELAAEIAALKSGK